MASYGILGFGRSGRAVLEYLLSLGEENITLYVPPTEVGETRKAYPHLRCLPIDAPLNEEVLVRSPGLRPDRKNILSAISRGSRLTGEVELFCQGCPAPIYAVTGSDGKTTTATMAARLLEHMGHTVWLGGNIGVPLLPRLREILPHHLVVLELSSFQLMTFAPRLSGAAVTNLTENHLNWHTSMEEYRWAKRNLLLRARRRVQNALSPVAEELSGLTFSGKTSTANYFVSHGTLYHGDIPLGKARLSVPGLHNIENLLCAAALTDATPQAVAEVADTFSGVPHRTEYLGEVRGVRCYNSSIDTTPSRTAVTLAALGGENTVICGGYDKGLSPLPLLDALLGHAGRVVFTGGNGEGLRDALLSHPAYLGVPEAVYVHDFDTAVRTGLEMTPVGGALVLSPAAASFDAFSSFEERGDAFRRLVEGYKRE